MKSQDLHRCGWHRSRRVLGVLCLVLAWSGASRLPGASFRRGDTDSSGDLRINDAVQIFGYLFLGNPVRLTCADAADADDDGNLAITDGIRILGYLFLGTAEPPAPGPLGCGPDPTPDDLTCEASPICTEPPVAVLRVTPETGEAPLSVTLSALDSRDPDGSIVAYEWELGDGEIAAGAVVSHTYAEPGEYPVRLTVTDNQGAASTAEVVVRAVGWRLTTIESTSPVPGEHDVAVTREAVVRFTRPVMADSWPEAIVARFAGKVLEARYHVSHDARQVTLFFWVGALNLPGLPPTARIRLSIDGSRILDDLGRPVDADGDSLPGGTVLVDFDTLTLTTVPGTAVTGHVYASELSTTPGQDSVNVPLKGVTISVDGLEHTLYTLTDEEGKFRLDPAPAGRFFVHIHGYSANVAVPPGAYYPYVGKAWQSVAGQETDIGNVYLPLIAQGTLKDVSATQETEISFPQAVLAEHPELEGVSIVVPADSAFAEDGTRGGQVGIAPVPPDRIPGPLPAGLEFPVVITVQSDGASDFDRPVPACFPNLPDPGTGAPLAPGEKNYLYSYNHDKGDWEAIGSMTVSEDGKLICTDPGVGIQAPGWHGSGPPPVGPPPCQDLCCPPPGGSGAIGESPEPKPLRVDGRGGGAASCGCGDQQDRDCSIRHRDCFERFRRIAVECLDRCARDILYSCSLCEQVNRDGRSLCDRIRDQCMSRCSESPIPAIEGAGAGAVDLPCLEDGGAAEVLRLLESLEGVVPSDFDALRDEEKLIVRTEVATILEQVEAAAGTSPGRFLETEARGLEACMMSQRVPQDVGNAPPYRIPFAASLVGTESKFELRGHTDPHGQYRLFLPRSATLAWLAFHDPETGGSGLVSPSLLDPLSMPRFTLARPAGGLVDSDSDSLGDLAEFVLGTDPAKPDSDADGISDGAEVEQGTDPLDGRPVRTGVIASVDTPGIAVDVCAANDTAIVANSTAGISVINVRPGRNPTVIAQVDTPGAAQAVECSGSLVAVADGIGGLLIVDITDPPAARIARQIVGSTPVESVAVAGGIAFAGERGGRVAAVDLRTGAVLKEVDAGSRVWDLATEKDTLYVLTQAKLLAYNLSDRSKGFLRSLDELVLEGRQPSQAGNKRHLTVGAGRAFATFYSGFDIVSIVNPEDLVLVRTQVVSQNSVKQLALTGSGRVVGTVGFGTGGGTDPENRRQSVYVYDDNGDELVFVTELETPRDALALSLDRGLAYVADSDEFGLSPIDPYGSGMHVVNFLEYDSLGQPPEVSIETNVGSAAEYNQLLRITATVTDDVQVSKVRFLVDVNVVAEDGNFPFETILRAPAAGDTLRLSAQAWDTGGNVRESAESSIQLVEDATPPEVVEVSPAGESEACDASVISVYFSEPVLPSVRAAEVFSLVSAGGDSEFGTEDDTPVEASAMQVEFREEISALLVVTDAVLLPGRYRAVLSTDIEDAAGNQLREAFAWEFDAAVWVKTTVIGMVKSEDGIAVGGAVVSAIYKNEFSTDTAADGTFSLTVEVRLGVSEIVLGIRDSRDSESTRCASVSAPVVEGGVSDIGVVVLVSADCPLVLHLAFEDNLLDSSSFRNDGAQLQGEPTFVEGILGRALSFTGQSGEGIRIAHSDSLQLSSGMTLSAWIKPHQDDVWGAIVFKGELDGLGPYELNVANDLAAGRITANLNGSIVYAVAIGTVRKDVWQHIAATYDRETLRVYHNGLEVASTPYTAEIQPEVSPLYIGVRYSPGTVFRGAIDDVRVYNVALSREEIQGFAASSRAGK